MSNAKFIITALLIPITILTATITEAVTEAETLPSGGYAIFKPVGQFSDVKAGNSYYVAIEFLRARGVIEGYTMNDEDTFRPKQNITRAEALKIFLLASKNITDFEEALDYPEESPFSDVPADAWFAPYVAIAKEKNIISGYKDGTFKPEAEINLAEALKIYFESIVAANPDLINFADGMETDFLDTAPDAWYSKYTSFAGAHNLINIYSDNTINPDQTMTRGYLAEVIYRTLQNQEGFEFGKATFYFGIPSKNNDSYDQNGMTTAHKTLPKGTILEVTNLANGQSVKVKVTDRGPYGPGRVLDLSKIAFAKIASPSEGVINIQFQQVSTDL